MLCDSLAGLQTEMRGTLVVTPGNWVGHPVQRKTWDVGSQDPTAINLLFFTSMRFPRY